MKNAVLFVYEGLVGMIESDDVDWVTDLGTAAKDAAEDEMFVEMDEILDEFGVGPQDLVFGVFGIDEIEEDSFGGSVSDGHGYYIVNNGIILEWQGAVVEDARDNYVNG